MEQPWKTLVLVPKKLSTAIHDQNRPINHQPLQSGQVSHWMLGLASCVELRSSGLRPSEVSTAVSCSGCEKGRHWQPGAGIPWNSHGGLVFLEVGFERYGYRIYDNVYIYIYMYVYIYMHI